MYVFFFTLIYRYRVEDGVALHNTLVSFTVYITDVNEAYPDITPAPDITGDVDEGKVAGTSISNFGIGATDTDSADASALKWYLIGTKLHYLL
jgi:hypothetical protein